MTDAPERIWAIEGFKDGWVDGHCTNEPAPNAELAAMATEYLRADHALALVAEAYEVAARECGGANITTPILTPSDALAAREADRKRVRDEALREAADAMKPMLLDLISRGKAYDTISALIERDQTDG